MSVLPSPSRRRLVLVVSILLFAAVRWWSAAGVDWSRMRNPDEETICRWIGQVRQFGYPAERVYPGGWFQLFRLRMAFDRAADALEARSASMPPRPAFRPEPAPPRAWSISDARRFNLSLHAGTAVVVLLAGLEAGFALPAALFGAAFFAVQALPLEAGHYCETDEALVFMLALTLWLALRALRRGGRGRFLLAALSAGFAFSCKFTLAPLVLLAPVLPPLLPGRPERASRREAVLAWAGLAAAGLACFAAGFLAGTPALVLDPGFFFHSLPKISAMTYRETLRTLGPMAGVRWAPLALRAGSLATELGKLGWAVPAWLLLSAAAFLAPRENRRLAVVPLFVAVFAVHALVAMPWIRSQETLVPLVSLCLLAGAPVDRALRRLRGGARGARLAGAGALLAAGAAALVVAAGQGSRMLSAFRDPDTRRLFGVWLRTSLPPDRLVATDSYAGPRGLMFPNPNDPLFHRLPERYDRDRLEAATNRPDYYVRNASFVGRDANRSLWTRRLLPDAQARLDAFREDFPLLAAWRLPPGTRLRPVFNQHDVELYALPRRGAAGSDLAPVDLAFDRPRLVGSGDAPLWTGDMRAPVGPVWAVRTVGKRTSVGLPAPPPGARLRAVTESAPGGAEVRVAWDGPMASPRGALRPGGAVAAELRPAAFAARSFFDVFPRARVRIRGDESRALCATFLSSDPAETARALRLGGDPVAALAVVRAERDPAPACAAEGFLAALAAGEEPDPAWRRRAAAALAAWDVLAERLRAAEEGRGPFPEAAAVRGAPVFSHRDFARASIGELPAFPGEPLPFLLPPGAYRLRFTVRAGDADWIESVRLVDGQSGPPDVVPLEGGDAVAFAVPFRLRRAAPLRLSASLPPADPAGSAILRDVELRWDPLEAIARSAEELRAALAVCPAAPVLLESAPPCN